MGIPSETYHDRFYFTDEVFDVSDLRQAYQEQILRENALWKRRESQDPTVP
jgi:hypothetical protein